jgi:FixJ family two-component response regulator
MPTKPEVVAVIDDDLGVRGAIRRLLSALGYHTELYASAKEFLAAAMRTEAICLIVDIELGGIEFARCLVNTVTTPIIFMTAHDSESFKRRAVEMGCVAFLRKPFSADALVEALGRIPRSA